MAVTPRKATIGVYYTDNGKAWRVYVDDNGALQVEDITEDL